MLLYLSRLGHHGGPKKSLSFSFISYLLVLNCLGKRLIYFLDLFKPQYCENPSGKIWQHMTLSIQYNIVRVLVKSV